MYTIEDVKNKFEEFCKDEVLAHKANQIPDLKKQNDAFDRMHQHVIPDMHAQLGIIRLYRLSSPLFYKIHSGRNSHFSPRVIHKIAHYKHCTYDHVWIVYCSPLNVEQEQSSISHAYFMIEKENALYIAQECIYSNYASDGLKYEWSPNTGLDDLNFESLDELIEIKRYIEPCTELGRQLFMENK